MHTEALTPPPVVRSAEADPGERGRAFGAGSREGILRCWAGYERLFDVWGADLREIAGATFQRTQAWAPSLAAELEGIAAGAGLDTWQIAALNARTEILARGRGECSTVVLLSPDAPPRTLQTWDWHEHLDDVKFVWEMEPRPGHVVRTLTEYGIAGKIGVNSAGLGVHMNILHHSADGVGAGVPVHIVARRILDEASTVGEATEIARSAEMCASTVLTAVDRDSATCLELCPVGLGEIRPNDGVLLHTNHFLDPELAAGEDNRDEDPESWDRLDALQQRVDQLRTATDLSDVMRLHDAPVCCHPEPGAPFGERYATLATISLDVAGGHLRLRAGGPCADESPWITV
jgi:isopenicillin-N N-acyltransferase-like protein